MIEVNVPLTMAKHHSDINSKLALKITLPFVTRFCILILGPDIWCALTWPLVLVRETAYNTLVRPQLEYTSAVWDPHSMKRICQIEQVQRRAAHWTVSNFDRQASVTKIVHDLGWHTLVQRRADARLCLFYKILHGLVAVPLPDYIQDSNRISRYCHSMTFRQVSTSTDYYKYSFSPLAIVQLNALPQSAACSQSLEVFKAAVCKLQYSRP